MMRDFKTAQVLAGLLQKEYAITFCDSLDTKTKKKETSLHSEARRIFCYIINRKTHLSIRQIMPLLGLRNHSSIIAIKREWSTGKLDHLKTEVYYFEQQLNNYQDETKQTCSI